MPVPMLAAAGSAGIFDLEGLVALLTLTALEIVLGIDNVIFIAVLAGKLPAEVQERARRIGISVAVVSRILLLLSITWVMTLEKPLFSVFSHGFTGKDLILIAGGLLLIAKATFEIHDKLEGMEAGPHVRKAAATLGGVVVQILLIHVVFSLDSTGVGLVNLIKIVDPFSRVRASWACLNRRKAAGPDYQLALRKAFFCFGKPRVISLDHDSAFFDNTTPSPFPSPLHLWLIAMGVEVRFLEHRPPREHACIERSHQIIHPQAVQGQSATPASLQPYLDQRLEFLNQHYPSRSLNRQAPLVAVSQAAHSGREYRPEWEEDTLELQKVYAYLSKQEWFRQSSDKGQLLLGSHRYGLGKDWSKQTIRITFDSSTQEYICCRVGSDNQQTERLKANGLTKTDLMAELNMSAFANHQYAFPWEVCAIRKNQIADLIGTTL